jgi:hypothetical protein
MPIQKQTPRMVTGMRPPRSVLEEQAIAEASQAKVQLPVEEQPEGTVYESVYLRYRLQIAATDDTKDPVTGRRIPGRTIVAQFEEGRFVNNPKKRGKPDLELRKLIDEAMQSEPHFGYPHGHFWLAETAMAKNREVAIESAKATIASIPPELREKLIADMVESGELQLTLPPRKSPNEVQPEV